MFGQQIEEEYINKISKADAVSRGRSQWPILNVFIIGVIALITWASLFEVEEVTKGIGRVIPSSQVQVVQTLEGGIIRSIAIEEGDVVEQGQALMQIDDTSFSSQLGELTERETALIAEQTRLEAEAGLKTDLIFPANFEKEHALAVNAEREVFRSRQTQLAGEVEVLKDRLSQRRAELAEMVATRAKLDAIIAPLTKEVALTRSLYRQGVVPEVEFLQLQSRLAEHQGDLAIGAASMPKLEASIREAENQIKASETAYILTSRERLATLQGELAVVQETLRAATDRVTRTQIRAPVRGIVNKINKTTIGAVLQPGVDIVEIVPIDDGLLIEADIRPQDVAFIKPGEAASVKITAYDYLVYGALEGKVVRIGADTIEDKEGEELFRVIVRTETNHLGSDDKKLPIIPGMVASIDIQTGSKTVLTYLMKPILRARSEALRER